MIGSKAPIKQNSRVVETCQIFWLTVVGSKALTKQSGGRKASLQVNHISTHELDKKSDKHVNIQVGI